MITSAVAQLWKTPDKNDENDQNDDERSVPSSNLVTKGRELGNGENSYSFKWDDDNDNKAMIMITRWWLMTLENDDSYNKLQARLIEINGKQLKTMENNGKQLFIQRKRVEDVR